MVVRRAGPAVVLAVCGDVDRDAGDALLPAYGRAAAGGSRVVLDLTGVEEVTFEGVSALVTVLARARSGGRTVVVCGLSERNRRVFAVTRLSDYVTVYPDLAGALRG